MVQSPLCSENSEHSMESRPFILNTYPCQAPTSLHHHLQPLTPHLRSVSVVVSGQPGLLGTEALEPDAVLALGSVVRNL